MGKKKRREITVLGMHDRDLLHHAILLLIVICGLAGIVALAHQPVMQFVIGTATAVVYVAWGIVHHYIDGDLHVKSVIEYVLLGILGILVLWVQFL